MFKQSLSGLMKGFFQNIEKQPSLGELHYLISKVVSKNAEQMLPCKLWLKAEETFFKDLFLASGGGLFPPLPWVFTLLHNDPASGSLWKTPDSNPGPLPQKSGATTSPEETITVREAIFGRANYSNQIVYLFQFLLLHQIENAEFAIIERFLLRQNVFKHEILINITKSKNCKFLV